MRRSQWSVQEAKDKLAAVMKAARTKPQTITKHGKADVVVLGVEEFERLKQFEKVKKPTFTEHLLAIPKDDGEFERITIEPRDIEF